MKDTDDLQRRARRPQADQRLYRSANDKVVAGVAGGLAEFISANPAIIRALFAAATMLTAGVFLIAYGLLWLMLPAD